MKPRSGMNPISHGLLLDKYFIPGKGISTKRLKNLCNVGMKEFIQWLSANQNTTNFLEAE